MAKSGIEARRKAALEEGGGVYIARREEMRSILDKGRCDGTLRADLPSEVCSLALFGMINWMHRWYRPGMKWSPEEITKTFTEIFLNGYGARVGNASEAS